MFAIGRVTSRVTHDFPDLFALDVAVDPGHPGIDLVGQQPLTHVPDVAGPAPRSRRCGGDPRQTVIARVFDQPGDPADAVFGRARKIPEPGMRAHDHRHVGKALDEHAKISLRPVAPGVLQRNPIDASDIDAIEGAGDRVEAGGVNNQVEFVLRRAGFNACRRHALDRRFRNIDEFDVRLVIDFVIMRLQWQPARAKAMIFRDQLFGDGRVFDPLADFARDEAGNQRVGVAIDQNVAKIGLPDAEARFAVAFFPESLPFLRRRVEDRARVGAMDEAARGFVAARENIVVTRPDVAHFASADRAVVQWRAPVGGALEHGQVANVLGDGLDGLDRRCAGADHRDPLAREVHRFFRPVRGVAGLSGEAVEPGNVRHGRRRQHADRGDQKPRAISRTIRQRHVPAARILAVMRRGHAAVTPDIAAQIEFIGDEIQITFGFRLRREMFGPIPFLQQFLRKRITVGPAFGIETGTGVAIPVPGAPDIGAGFQDQRLEAKRAQPVQLIQAGDASADDDGIVIQIWRGVGRCVAFPGVAHRFILPHVGPLREESPDFAPWRSGGRVRSRGRTLPARYRAAPVPSPGRDVRACRCA